MEAASYVRRRGEIETYFDRTAADVWARLTSDAPVSGIRATVRAGRDRMRALLLDWLPDDLRGRRLLDAGCGTGALAVEAAQRGATVTATDLSPNLIEVARQRLPDNLGDGSVSLHAGDMLDPALGRFDFVVGMDSLIHYRLPDALRAVGSLAERCDEKMLFTFAPGTPALMAMRAAGRLFPRGDRAPAIEPVNPTTMLREVASCAALAGWRLARTERVSSGFYKSQALELVRR